MSRHRVCAAAVLALTGAAALGAQTPEPAYLPAARIDPVSQTVHQQLVQKAAKGGIDVYFVGDSIVRRWGAIDYPEFLANWKQNFFGWNAANFGWAGDKTQHILWRLENGELDGVNPKVIVILAGTNNLTSQPGGEATVRDLTHGLLAILAVCREKAPSATIVLTAILPRGDNRAVLRDIYRINANLARLDDGDRVRFLNINDQLADSQGRLLPGVMYYDRLHLSLKGYQIWADALKPILTGVLGAPAATDHAPPPTGDPSASSRGVRIEAPLTAAQRTSLLAISFLLTALLVATIIRRALHPSQPLQAVPLLWRVLPGVAAIASLWIWSGLLLVRDGPPTGWTRLVLPVLLLVSPITNYWSQRVTESIVGRERPTDVTRLFGDGGTR
jgi:lysophospholipase L1-like esterase